MQTQILKDESLDRSEVLEYYDKLKQDTIFFGSFILPEMFYSKSAKFHYELAEAMNDPKIQIVVVKIFRGGAKSSLCQAFVLQQVAFKKHKVILYVGDTSDRAETHVETIRMELETNGKIERLFGKQKGDRSWGAQRFTTAQGITVLPRGSNQSIRGVKIGHDRPTLLMFDDIEKDEGVETQEQRDKLWNRIFASLKPILEQRGEGSKSKIIMVGTLLHEDSVLARMIELVEHMVSQGRTDAKVFDYPVADEVGNPTWPEVWTKDRLEKEQELYESAGLLDVFYREYYGKVLSPEGCPFKKEDTRFWPRDYPLPKKSDMLFYFALDLAFKTGKVNDYSALVCIGIADDGRAYVVEAVRGRFDHAKGEFAKLLIDYCKSYNPMSVFLQNILLDEFFAFVAKDSALNSDVGIPFETVKISREKNAKVRRIQQVAPLHKTGRIIFGPHQHELLEELYTVPRSKFDDLSDCLAVLTKEVMMPKIEEEVRESEGYFHVDKETGRYSVNFNAIFGQGKRIHPGLLIPTS